MENEGKKQETVMSNQHARLTMMRDQIVAITATLEGLKGRLFGPPDEAEKLAELDTPSGMIDQICAVMSDMEAKLSALQSAVACLSDSLA